MVLTTKAMSNSMSVTPFFFLKKKRIHYFALIVEKEML